MTPLRVGVVGLGTIARFYLEALERSPSIVLAGVCDMSAERLRPFEGRVPTATDHRALLKLDLDAIVVCVPNDVHARVAGDAIAAGKHVCIEKPLATELDEGRRLVALARAERRVLFTAFHRRYNVNILRLAERLKERRPARIAARYLEDIREHVGVDPWYLDPARCGGGCVTDNGPNVFDTLRFLTGELELVESRIFFDRAGLDRQALISLVSRAGVPVDVELDWAYPDGEAKDVTVWLDDGSTLRADMLAGFDGFKSSLAHEYEAILDDFKARIDAGRAPDVDDGLAALELVEEAYRLAGVRQPVRKRAVSGRLVALLTHSRTDRGMSLIEHETRCVTRDEIHELVTTDQRGLGPGQRVDRVGFLGFAEIARAGVIERGDTVEIAGRRIGTVVGFDACHHPNHYNIIIESDSLHTGASLQLHVEQPVRLVSQRQGDR